MKHIRLIAVSLFGVIGFSGCAAAPVRQGGIEEALARADLSYDQPVARSEAGLPIGNGRTGTLVWTTPSALHTQINRVDVFAVDRDTTSFPERHTDYCGGCAFADIDVHGPAFTGPAFHQSLVVRSGLAVTQGDGISIRAIACAGKDVFAFEVTDTRPVPAPISIMLRMLRPPVVKTFQHTAASTLSTRGNVILLSQTFAEADYFCASTVAAEVTGRRATIDHPSDTEIRLTAAPARGTFTILISSAATFDRHEDLAAKAVDALRQDAGISFGKLLASNEAWWRQFWSRSLVWLHSADGVADKLEANYTYYLYLMASTSRGQFPTKFNGMLWTTGGDTRKWGTQYWGANQSCLYNSALLAANHVDLTDPMFSMYTNMLPSCEFAAKQQWGSQGAFIPETVAFNGLAPLPDKIAAEMRGLYLMQKPWSSMSQAFHDYAAVRLPYSSRWNWIGGGHWLDAAHTQWSITERSPSPFGPVTHTFARGAKIAYEYWTRYQYTGGTAWLRDRAYPVLRDIAEFYRHFPNLQKESDGLYHIHHVNDNEALWDGTDTDEELSAMIAIFPTAIRAAEILHVDPNLRHAWREIADHLAPLPRSDNPLAMSKRTGTPVWIKAIPPAGHGRATGLPDSNTLPEWFFGLCTLESPPAMQTTANATFNALTQRDPERARLETARAAPRPAATQREGWKGPRISVLSKIPLAAAILGRASDVQTFLPAQSFQAETPVLANRMDLREGPQTTSAQRLGNAADALQTALCQSFSAGPDQPPVLRLFPAWPKSWDAQFTLLERGDFLVSSSIHDGQIASVEIFSQRGNDLRLCNPWPNALIRLTIDQNPPIILQPAAGELLILPTSAGSRLTLAPQTSAKKL